MSKTETSRFTEVVRRFVLAGGTMLCLAHTNKHADANGKNVFAGVADILDDLDCAYTIDVSVNANGERVAQLPNKKRRGNNPDTMAYAYSSNPELSYLERLTSVHETDSMEGGSDDGLDYKTSDDDILESLAMAIHHRPDDGKMAIICSVANVLAVSKRRVLKLLEQYTGEDLDLHRWRYVVRARGLHAFELLGPQSGNS